MQEVRPRLQLTGINQLKVEELFWKCTRSIAAKKITMK